MKLEQALRFTFLIICTFFALELFAQGKKVLVYELDMINGLFIQRNTIGPFSGVAFEDYPNGKKKLEIPIKEGKQNGVAKEWAKSGKKTYEAIYVNGIQEGKETQWYANGKKKLVVNYVNGIPSGVVTEWHRLGSKKSEGLFQNGKEEGEHKWWYSTGGLDQTVNYQNGRANGMVKNWYESGQLWMEKAFIDGQQNGTYKEWYIDGQKKKEGAFSNGIEHGDFSSYSKTGLLLGKQIFEEGKLIKDFNYRSGSLNIRKGYIEVFNSKESFFAVKIVGNDVQRKRTEDIVYVVDGKLLQIFKTPITAFYNDGLKDISNEELLNQNLIFEQKYISSKTNVNIEVDSETGTSSTGVAYLHWHFDSPSVQEEEQTPNTVNKEHYISFVCGDYIISLYSVITNGEEMPKSIIGMLKHQAKNIRVEQERIDLNQVESKLFGTN